MATVTFGFSAQSDEARHMTLGLEIVKFMLEQDEANVPIVQRWIDKWFWRGYRLLALVAMMMDYMLPKRVMSWQEAWEMYFEEGGGALFNDLSRYGIRLPKYHEVAKAEKSRLSHEVWSTFYGFTHAAHFHTWVPNENEMSWLASKYPDTFDKFYRPRYDFWQAEEQAGRRYYNKSLPALCQVCTIPMLFTDVNDPTTLSLRHLDYKGERYRFCSDGCKDIFAFEPEKYIQTWLPVHEILKGNCGGADLKDVLKYYNYNDGADNGEYRGSPEDQLWQKWQAERVATSSST
jgi:phenol hydroxylase P3 protein